MSTRIVFLAVSVICSVLTGLSGGQAAIDDYGSYDLVIGQVQDAASGSVVEVSLDLSSQGTPWPISGFDLLIQYDQDVLVFQRAVEGAFLTDCEWEYFSYRFGGSGACGAEPCPAGVVRIVALAEGVGGVPDVHPDCFANDGIPNPGPGSTTATGLTSLIFQVVDDPDVEYVEAPIRFVWYECEDNSLTSEAEGTLLISDQVYDVGDPFDNITGLDNTFPTVTGALSPECDAPSAYTVVRGVNFHDGVVSTAGNIDPSGYSGDLNCNGQRYEVADAVIYSNYFTIGLSAFAPHTECSIAASDLNGDGVNLSVADMVRLVRIVVGDQNPYAKEAPTAPSAIGYTVADGVVAVTGNIDISGAALVVQGSVTPELLADGMEMGYFYDGSVTRILVITPLDEPVIHSFRGAFVKGVYGNIVSLDLSTPDGVSITARNLPNDYTLSQNYPNPFNPQTTIEFTLPAASDYRLTIFNIAGQQVDMIDGHADAPGFCRVSWNADNHASGVYLYRLDAGLFSQTRKMLLLK